MAANNGQFPVDPERGQEKEIPKPTAFPKEEDGNYCLNIFQSTLNLLAHILIGATVGIVACFVFRNSIPLNITNTHILLCVFGYSLCMSQAILSISDNNGWSSRLKFVDKRRAHWILQIVGSGLALAGSLIKIIDQQNHFISLHGKFAWVAMIFTFASLVNGLTSLYAYEMRNCINGNYSKLTHICFGTVAFVSSSISFCYGMDKNLFKNWATQDVAMTTISFVGAYTFIVILNPVVSFFNKTKLVIKTHRIE